MRALINTQEVTLPRGARLLDFLREELGLTAAKPACRGGDCGACLVLLGEIAAGETRAHYRAVNSCLLTTDRVEGCHVVTPEALRAPAGGLTPVQRELLERGGVQCGYCTPGFVVALTAALLAGAELTAAVDGNLCRCTGYAGIRRACAALGEGFAREPMTLAQAAAMGLLPRAVADAGARLAPLAPESLDDGFAGAGDGVAPPQWAGGDTDWAVQNEHAAPNLPRPRLARIPQLRRIALDGDFLAVGAAVTIAELQANPQVAAAWPALPAFLEFFASPGIRNSATVGGNLVNASPAADLATVLLALGAEVELRAPGETWRLPLEAFFLSYRRTALPPGGVLTTVHLPRNAAGARRLAALKVARRGHDDITSVTTAICADAGTGGLGEVRLAAGGVAPVPRFLPRTSAALSSDRLRTATVRRALEVLAAEATPIDDVRGSARYKADLLAYQLISHLVELRPQAVAWEELL